jgi:hypothetical protein
MLQTSPTLRRSFIAYVLVISLFAVSVAAATPAHSHPGVKADACAICKASEIPITGIGAAIQIWPPSSVSEALLARYAGIALEAQTTGLHSRAPPSL